MLVFSALVLLLASVSQPAFGQSSVKETSAIAADKSPSPRTDSGAPDLQGVWDYRTMTPLERPRDFAGKETLTPEEAAAYEQQQNALLADYDRAPSVHAKWWLDYGTALTEDKRTSLLIEPPDGRLPAVTDDAKRRSAARSEQRRRHPADAAENRGLTERCLTFGMPRLPGAYNNNFQILQTPTHVAIISEMIHDARIIPLDSRPFLSSEVSQWHGNSRGRYEGDTLVVETRNFSEKSAFRGSTPALHLIERFTRVNPETAYYEFTVSDPSTWASDWTALVPMKKTAQAIYEYACHEGNHGLRNILHNARFEEDQNYTDKLPKPQK